MIKEKIAYMECVIQSSMFYSFYLFLSILLCNADGALVSDSNAYIWISNCIQMFEFILYVAFQELEWHPVGDVDFDDAEADILEIAHEIRTLVLDDIKPIWTSDWQ